MEEFHLNILLQRYYQGTFHLAINIPWNFDIDVTWYWHNELKETEKRLSSTNHLIKFYT